MVRDAQMFRMNICACCKEGIVFDPQLLLWIRARARIPNRPDIRRDVCPENDDGHQHVPDDDVRQRADRHLMMVVLAGDDRPPPPRQLDRFPDKGSVVRATDPPTPLAAGRGMVTVSAQAPVSPAQPGAGILDVGGYATVESRSPACADTQALDRESGA